MSYNEYTWQTGETITAEKLNNLEGGVQEALSSSSGSVEVIKLGEYNGTIGASDPGVINASPYPYNTVAVKLKEIIDGGKKIVNIVCDCDNQDVGFEYARYDDMDIIVHQFDPSLFIEDNSKMMRIYYSRLRPTSTSLTFTAILYAICI